MSTENCPSGFKLFNEMHKISNEKKVEFFYRVTLLLFKKTFEGIPSIYSADPLSPQAFLYLLGQVSMDNVNISIAPPSDC